MKATKTLILGFRSVIDHLQRNKNYNWDYVHICNCGLLARALLGVDGSGLMKLINEDVESYIRGSWTNMASLGNGYCKMTGQPNWMIFRELAKHGLEKEDFEVIERCGRTREQVIRWFETKVEMLEQELKASKSQHSVCCETASTG